MKDAEQWGSPLMVTGGAGFIGANLVHLLLERTHDCVLVVDKLTYAGHLSNLADAWHHPRLRFIQADIADRPRMEEIFAAHRPAAVLNLAAETHVDRSIDDPSPFVETNIVGTAVLLEVARRHLANLPSEAQQSFRFLHVSTDEVYGALGDSGRFSEETPYAPNSPYSASKAAADHLVRAYYQTYRLPVLITNCSNNFGPYQFPEKLIPLALLNAIDGRAIAIYGDGRNVRDWLYVEDHCAGLVHVLEHGRAGEKYNIGGDNERTNVEVVDALCRILEEQVPAASNPALTNRGINAYEELKTFVPDRPGHDQRYAINAEKIRDELSWAPQRSFEDGLRDTVAWYLGHRPWCEEVLAGRYDRARLGLSATVS
jgi:dTDP-glucose 4,6-dehydratase